MTIPERGRYEVRRTLGHGQISFSLSQYTANPFVYKASATTTASCQSSCGGTSNYCYGAVTCYYGTGTATSTIGTTLSGTNAYCSASSTAMFSVATTSTTGATNTGVYCWCPSTCTSTLAIDYLADNPVGGAPTSVPPPRTPNPSWPCVHRLQPT